MPVWGVSAFAALFVTTAIQWIFYLNRKAE